MRKIFLLITLFFLLGGINLSFSARYGGHWRDVTVGDGPTWCDIDGDTTGGSPMVSPGNGFSNYTYDSRVNGASGNNMWCEYWDGVNPSVSYTNSKDNIWTNLNVTVSINCSDSGGSGCDNSSYQYRESSSNFTCDSSGLWNNGNSKTYSTDLVKYICFRAKDIAGNGYIYSGVSVVKIDKTPPSASDISSSILNGGYFRATTSIPINIVGNSAGGSPIELIQGKFENINNESLTNTTKSSNSDNNSYTKDILETNEDISKVDNFRTVNNYRNYTYNVINVCDEAGNCTVNPTSFSYNVYAGYVSIGNSSTSGSTNFIGQTADASTKTLTLTLNDVYNNKIVPVYQSNGTTLVRDIGFTLNYNNNLYLNQYNKTGAGVEVSGFDDSVYSNSSIGSSQTRLTTINNKSNNDGVYSLNFKVYSPTYSSSATDGRQFVDGNFYINNITSKLTDNPSSDNLFSNLDFQFKPLYKTDITGSIINKGFIVGTTQTGTLDITPGGIKNVYLEYGYYDGALSDPHRQHTKIDLNYKKSSGVSWDVSTEGYKEPYSSLSLFGDSSSNLFTKLVQDGTLTTSEQNTYFATHIQTTVGGKTVVYSSDIYGMDRYAGTPNGDNTSQRGVKITGITHSQNKVDLVTGQSSSDISFLGNLEKSYLQRDVRENAYSLVKNITSNNGIRNITNINQSSPGVRLGDVLYFGNLNGENVTINLSGTYSGVKTILVQGGNVYIKQNILAANKANDILGIIALKNDSTGNGGNIYIHPDVLEIDAVLYADRAIVSYDGSEISPDNGGTYEYLSKQLYIYGTVFSNNTIGGSVQSPYLCPFYITSCTLDNAQKYDMNYLRRGYETKQSGSYADYPVIINYNSLIQITPPPLFEKK